MIFLSWIKKYRVFEYVLVLFVLPWFSFGFSAFLLLSWFGWPGSSYHSHPFSIFAMCLNPVSRVNTQKNPRNFPKTSLWAGFLPTEATQLWTHSHFFPVYPSPRHRPSVFPKTVCKRPTVIRPNGLYKHHRSLQPSQSIHPSRTLAYSA